MSFNITGINQIKESLARKRHILQKIKGGLDGQTFVHNGQIVVEVEVDQNRLSPNKEEAIKEYEYIEALKKGEAIKASDRAKMKRLVRDLINQYKGEEGEF